MVKIEQTRALSYRVPTRRSRAGLLNYVVELRATAVDGTSLIGLGEGQPRGVLTGDNAGDSWRFLSAAVGRLHQKEMPTGSPKLSVRYIETIMGEFESMAEQYRRTKTRTRAFRGTLLAIEMALIDLAARAQRLSLSEFLKQVYRDALPNRIGLARDAAASEGFDELNEQSGHLQIELPANAEAGVVLAKKFASAEKTGTQPLWAIAGDLQRHTRLHGYFKRLATAAANGDGVPRKVVIQISDSVTNLRHRELLQRSVNSAAIYARFKGIDIRLLQQVESPTRRKLSDSAPQAGTRKDAIDLRPAQAGGILKSVQIIDRIVNNSADPVIAFNVMEGTGRIARTAVRQLAHAISSLRLEEGLEHDEGAILVAGYVHRLAPPSDTVSPEHWNIISEPVSEWSRRPEMADDDNEEEVGENLATDKSRSSKIVQGEITEKAQYGVGLNLLYEQLVGPTIDYVTFPMVPPPTFNGRPANRYDDVAYIRPMGSYAVHGHLLEREALAYGLNTRRFSKSTFLADDGSHEPLAFRTARSPLTSVVASSIVRHKEVTRLLLGRSGSPVPEGRTFSAHDWRNAIDYAERIGYPVVVKPTAGSMGVGVTANIRDVRELKFALRHVRQSVMAGESFLIEKHIQGRDYRIMVLGDEVVAAVERVPASVLGDGRSTLIELILAKNAHRKENTHLGPLKLKWNEKAAYEAQKSGYSANSVLPVGQRVYLNSVNNLTQGGDSIDIFDELHPSIIDASVKAVAAVPGLTYCGVDFLLEDHTKPLSSQVGAIIELNAVAAIPVAEYPMFGTPRPMSERFMRRCIDEFGLAITPTRADTLNLQMHVKGRVTSVGYTGWFARRARAFGCDGWIRTTGRRSVQIRISGPTAPVAALATAAVLGPARARPTSVTTTHETTRLRDGFRIVRSPLSRVRRWFP